MKEALEQQEPEQQQRESSSTLEQHQQRRRRWRLRPLPLMTPLRVVVLAILSVLLPVLLMIDMALPSGVSAGEWSA